MIKFINPSTCIRERVTLVAAYACVCFVIKVLTSNGGWVPAHSPTTYTPSNLSHARTWNAQVDIPEPKLSYLPLTCYIGASLSEPHTCR